MSTLRIAVIGGGAAGLSAAETAQRMGAATTLFERQRLGGECTWSGCVPSKALLAAAKTVHSIRVPAVPGITADSVSIDFEMIVEHVQNVIRDIARTESAEEYRKRGITVIEGEVHFASSRSLECGGEPYTFDRAIICTGSAPAIPPVPGIEEVPYVTNETVFGLKELPEKLLILGAGPIGLELGQAFRRLGSEVHIVDIASAILPMVAPEIRSILQSSLEEEGVAFHLSSKVSKIAKGDPYWLAFLGDDTDPVQFTHLLVAAGRSPRYGTLGLTELGVAVNRKGIVVDEGMRTSVDGIYAAGDVTGVMPLTHVAAYQARVAVAHALGKHRKATYSAIPWAIYTDPPVAGVGNYSEKEGETVLRRSYEHIDRAILENRLQGIMLCGLRGKPVLGKAGGGEIAWAQVAGIQADEVIHEFAMAMHTHAFAGRLAQAVHAYPTIALGIQQLVAQAFLGE